MGKVRVGTSGYRYWPGDVHPPKTSTDDALRLYAGCLPSVELNRTFYQVPRASSIEKWQTLVPADFTWAIKIWRRISHEKQLIGVEADWNHFLTRVRPLLNSGVLLLQLAKTFPQKPAQLESFLKTIPAHVRVAIEFRHAYWFSSSIYKLLEKYAVALVSVSAPGVPTVLDVQTAPFRYYRLHGPRTWYRDRYTLAELSPFIDAARRARDHGDVYVYFDNTIGGHAYWNALEFQRQLEAPSLVHTRS